MPIPLRGWARPRSAAARLAACEQLIGHSFNNVDLLRQALNSRESVSRRLAVVGDRAVETHLAYRWWEKKGLDGIQWTELRTSVLSNENLSKVGFRVGINECTLPDSCESNMTTRMATAIEALLAAVWLDTNRDAAALEKVIDRLGLTHILLDAGTERAWLYSSMTSSRTLPRCFFSGHHLALTKTLAELEQPIIPLREALLGQETDQSADGRAKGEESPSGSARRVSNTCLRLKHFWFEMRSQLSWQVSPSERPSSKGVSSDAEPPKSSESVERARDDAVLAQVSRDQGTGLSASSDVVVKKDDHDIIITGQQIAHDRVALSREEDPKTEESVEQAPSDTKCDASNTKRHYVQVFEPTAHKETGTFSAKDVDVDQGHESSEGNPKEDSRTQDHEAAQEQERADRMRVLQKRIDKLSRKQSVKANPARHEELNKVIAQLDALKENTREAVL